MANEIKEKKLDTSNSSEKESLKKRAKYIEMERAALEKAEVKR